MSGYDVSTPNSGIPERIQRRLMALCKSDYGAEMDGIST
jgi:hypothetical protein